MNNNGTELATVETGQAVRALTAQDLLNRVERIREVQAKVMRDGVDYGTIQGCGDKPTLLKPGAETLLLAFEMAALPDQMSIQDLGDADEVRYRVITPIVHVPTNRLCGNGVGECSSMEEKYKWRKAVCEAEFENTDPDRRRLKYYKDGGTAQQVRTNKADVANTVLKMAKKRSLVDGALTVTAASRVFTQDVEDLPEELRDGHAKPAKKDAPTNEPHVPNYGKYAGKAFSEVPTDGEGGLRDYLAGVERSIDDPKKARFKASNEKQRDALKAEIAKRDQTSASSARTASGAAAPPAPPATAPEQPAAGPPTGSEGSEEPGYPAEWLSKVMDAEDFLRNSMTGKATLKSIRTEFKLTGADYPLFDDTQAAYLDKVNAAVKAMQGR